MKEYVGGIVKKVTEQGRNDTTELAWITIPTSCRPHTHHKPMKDATVCVYEEGPGRTSLFVYIIEQFLLLYISFCKFLYDLPNHKSFLYMVNKNESSLHISSGSLVETMEM